MELAKRLEGLQTVSTISKIMGVSRRTAINYVYELRKKGLVDTIYQKRRIRMYRIKTVKPPEKGYPGLYDVINKYSRVKLAVAYTHRVYAHKLTVEEAIVKAIETKRFRTLLAALGLFSKINDWHSLYEFAKKAKAERKAGALYDVARSVIKVRRMDKRTRKALLKSRCKDKFIIDGLKTRDFMDIEKEWGVYIPLNRADLEVYKE